MKPYHFTIDRDGYGAAEFARGRYRWADAVLDHLDSETTDALADGSLDEFRVELDEAEAWDLVDDLTEDESFCALLSEDSPLYASLRRLEDSIT